MGFYILAIWYKTLESRNEVLALYKESTVCNTEIICMCLFSDAFSIIFEADAHRTVLHGVELKKTSLQKLKKELENIERETESKLLDIDKNNAELEVSKQYWPIFFFIIKHN